MFFLLSEVVASPPSSDREVIRRLKGDSRQPTRSRYNQPDKFSRAWDTRHIAAGRSPTQVDASHPFDSDSATFFNRLRKK